MRPFTVRPRGSALFITLILGAGFAVLTISAIDRMVGMRKVNMVQLAKQRAETSAEAVAAMIESRLMDAAADYTKLTVRVDDPVNDISNPWWQRRGCVYKDAQGVMHGPGYESNDGNGIVSQSIIINDCAIRWMVEPVRVYSKAWSQTPAGDYVVNPPNDPSQELTWETDSHTGPNQESMPGDNKKLNDFYHFRVVAQAVAVREGGSVPSGIWNSPSERLAASQAMRVLQIQSLQLFKYALFYAAPTPVGDLDLQTGGTIWVQKGAVHSNGAIYIRGGESTGFYNKNWHQMASGDGGVDAEFAGQSIFLGEENWPITITGVGGIFRMGKTANQLAANNNLKFLKSGATVPFDRLVPTDVPTDGALFVSDDVASRSGNSPLDLNGDLANSNRHKFNGHKFTRMNDSRSTVAFAADFENYARDPSNGGTTVRTLQNIPTLGGRPFEPQSVISTVGGVLNPLYGDAGLTTVSRNPRSASGTPLQPLYYVGNPYVVSGSPVVGVSRPTTYSGFAASTNVRGTIGVGNAVTNWPVYAEDMRLWWNGTMRATDVLAPLIEQPLLDMIPSFWGKPAWGVATPNALDRESPLSWNGTQPTSALVAPVYVDNLNGGLSTISFPGVPFILPAGLGPDALGNDLEGQLWRPGFFGTGFSPREAKGYYLEAALFGDLPTSGTLSKQQQYYQNASAVPTNINSTGIVIRERRWQQRPMVGGMAGGGNEAVTAWNYYWPGTWLPGSSATWAATRGTFLNPVDPMSPDVATDVLPIRRPALGAALQPQDKLDYVQYLCSQYTVLFCGRNITAPFFGQILSQTNPRDFIVTEDEFVDARESGYMWGLYGPVGAEADAFHQQTFFTDPNGQPSTVPGTVAASNEYRQNVLTIHMKAFQDWLRATPMASLGYPNSTDAARKHFSGVLYNHRTRRSDSMHPLFTPELEWPGTPRISNNVETTPARLVNQTHFRAYWASEVDKANHPQPAGLPPQTGAGMVYPPINFPWNWREPAGPHETSRCATRLKGQINDQAESSNDNFYRVYWNHSSDTSTGDPLGTSKFTYITPQRFYMWGHFCYKVGAITDETAGRAEIDANINQITPCAVFADNYTIQSARWRDAYAQELPMRSNGFGYPDGRAVSTCQFVSMVINNSPNSAWNCGSFGSAGQEGTFRMMEDWGYSATHVWWSGSQVVMNMGRYHHSGHNFIHYNIADGRANAPAHMGIGAFEASTNHYIFNTNLFSSAGRPPLSPSGVTATRVINQLSNFSE